MYKNIYEALEGWDWASFFENEEYMKEASKAIYDFKEHYEKTGEVGPKMKVKGVFKGRMCHIYAGNSHIGTIFDLVYSGRVNKYSDRRMYTNNDAFVWLDYAVYE